jgi:hypothetical protein
VHLGQRGRDVLHILEDLRRHGRVEHAVGHRQFGGVGFVERDVVAALGAFGGHGQHRRFGVDACDPAFRADLIEQLGHIETGPATHVENALTRLRGERLLDETPSAHDIAPAIDHFQKVDHALVEGELCHVRSLRSLRGEID